MLLKKHEFEEIINDAIKELPRVLREKMENVEIIIEEWPSKEVLEEMGISSKYGLLGLYRGIPMPERGTNYNFALPDAITLYQGPIERMAKDKNEIKKRIKEVVYHEIGHYYGFSEEELEGLEEG